MKRLAILALAGIGLISLICYAMPETIPMTDAEVKKVIIDGTLSTYQTGACPCPYSYNKDGYACGKNSIYIQNMDANKPKCYNEDIQEYEVKHYQSIYNIPAKNNKPHVQENVVPKTFN